MNHPEHIHTPDDGRGQRYVLLNGERVDNVVYANTSKGKVRVTRQPIRLDRWKKRILKRTIYGKVEVRPMSDEATHTPEVTR